MLNVQGVVCEEMFAQNCHVIVCWQVQMLHSPTNGRIQNGSRTTKYHYPGRKLFLGGVSHPNIHEENASL